MMFDTDILRNFKLTARISFICFAIFGFMYSKRKGTIAEKMDGQIPIEIKRKRVNKLFEVEKEISAELVKNLVGKEVEIIVDDKKGNVYIAIFGILRFGFKCNTVSRKSFSRYCSGYIHI